MEFERILAGEIQTDAQFEAVAARALGGLARMSPRQLDGVRDRILRLLSDERASWTIRYYTLHLLNLCVADDCGFLGGKAGERLSQLLVRLALAPPKPPNDFHRLLLECIEFWHVNEAAGQQPVFKRMYCELVNGRAAFEDKPAHVLKFLEALEGPGFQAAERTEPPADAPDAPEAPPEDLRFVLQSLDRVYGMLASVVKDGATATPFVGELVDALQTIATRLHPVRGRLTQDTLRRLSQALLLIQTYRKKGSCRELRSVLQPAGDAPKPGPRMVESINTSVHLPEDDSLVRRASPKRVSSLVQSRRSLQTPNCIVSFKDIGMAPPDVQAQKRTLPLRDKEAKEAKEAKEVKEVKEAPGERQEISFRSFDNRSGEKEPSQKGLRDAGAAPDRLVVALLDAERQRYKTKIRELRGQLADQKQRYEDEIARLKERVQALEGGRPQARAPDTALHPALHPEPRSFRFESGVLARTPPLHRLASVEHLGGLGAPRSDFSRLLNLNFEVGSNRRTFEATSGHPLPHPAPSPRLPPKTLEDSVYFRTGPSSQQENDRFPLGADRNRLDFDSRKPSHSQDRRLPVHPPVHPPAHPPVHPAECEKTRRYLAEFSQEISDILSRKRPSSYLAVGDI